MLARRIVKPLNELSTAARRIAMGDYEQPLPAMALDEIGQLASSFEHMRAGIASREERIVRLAYVDNLTELPNRTRFEEAFAQLSPGATGAIAVLNIDRFALINNALGYPIGDSLLRALGARLSRLLTPDFMKLKLDRSLVTDVAASPKNCAIVKSTIMLGHALGLTVVAEGVETPADLSWLRENDCDIAQGYGIARPMPAQAIPDWIAVHAAASALAPAC